MFDNEDDRIKVMDRSWTLFDHYLTVRTWSPEFVSSNAKIDSTLVWIRFPNLNLIYYDESFLMAVASAFGKPIKVDLNTLKVSRGIRFPRVCVEIDLGKPVVRKVGINNHWYTVEYEGLDICSTCGCYGHLSRDCKQVLTSKVNAAVETVDKVVVGTVVDTPGASTQSEVDMQLSQGGSKPGKSCWNDVEYLLHAT